MATIQYFLPLLIQTPASYDRNHFKCARPLLPCESLTVKRSRKEAEISPLLPPPYIRLEDLLDEPMGRGWGVDISGFGPTINFSSLQVVVNGPITPGLNLALQAHTLKPAEDSRFPNVHEDMHPFFWPSPDQRSCPCHAICGQVSTSLLMS